jgi:hypothetical protein
MCANDKKEANVCVSSKLSTKTNPDDDFFLCLDLALYNRRHEMIAPPHDFVTHLGRQCIWGEDMEQISRRSGREARTRL